MSWLTMHESLEPVTIRCGVVLDQSIAVIRYVCSLIVLIFLYPSTSYITTQESSLPITIASPVGSYFNAVMFRVLSMVWNFEFFCKMSCMYTWLPIAIASKGVCEKGSAYGR